MLTDIASEIVCTPQTGGRLFCATPSSGLSAEAVALFSAFVGALVGAILALGSTLLLSRRSANLVFRQLVTTLKLSVEDVQKNARRLLEEPDLAYRPALSTDWWDVLLAGQALSRFNADEASRLTQLLSSVREANATLSRATELYQLSQLISDTSASQAMLDLAQSPTRRDERIRPVVGDAETVLGDLRRWARVVACRWWPVVGKPGSAGP